MNKHGILIFVIILISFMGFSAAAEDIPPSFALTSFTVSSISPMGTWKDAFSPSYHLSFDLQYPARIINLYFGGKVEYTKLAGDKYPEVECSMFNINFLILYKILDFDTGSLFLTTGTGINFQQIAIEDASEDAVLGSFKAGASVKKQIAGEWLMTINSEYTYIPDSPYFTIGFGISYFFSKFQDQV